MKKKVLFDLSSTQPQGSVKINGGGEYATTIFLNLLAVKNDFEIIVLLNNKNGENILISNKCEESKIRIEYFDSINEIPIIVKENEVDLLVFPVCYSYYGNLKFDPELKIISVIHDLSHLSQLKLLNQNGRFDNYNFKDIIRKIMFELKKKTMIEKEINNHRKLFNLSSNLSVFTVSNYSKYAMRYFLEKPNNNIKVLYPPAKITGEIHSDELNVLERYGVKKNKYFLLVSGDRWAKNNERAIRALNKLLNDSKYVNELLEVRVLVLGVNERFEKYYKRITNNESKMIYFGYIDTEDLEILYKNAHLLVYPSLVEGFGYPPIEAMKYGTISACSIATSIPEICKGSSIYFNPYDIEDIAIKLLQSFDKEYMDELKSKSIARYQEISIKQSNDLNTMINEIIRITNL